jgi:L-2,4-diaminobutyric acid acetyltransferase
VRELIEASEMEIRGVRPGDAAAVHALVERCGVLELNTPYCYLLLADHFRATCVVAVARGELVGAVLGYRPPTRPDAIFVWQVGVDPRAQGRGLGGALLEAFVAAPGARGARFLEATVSPSNLASRALFSAFARRRRVELAEEPGYAASLFPEGHEPERLLRIGPLSSAPSPSPSPTPSQEPS